MQAATTSASHPVESQNYGFANPPAQPINTPDHKIAPTLNAGFSIRFFAYLLDGLIIQAAFLIFYAIPEPVFSAIGPYLPLAMFLATAIYHIYFWAYQAGATPGKKLFGLKVVLDSEFELTLKDAVLRYVGYIVSAIPLYLGFFWIIHNKENKGWHDIIAKTKVIVIDKSSMRWKKLGTIAFMLVYLVIYALAVFGKGLTQLADFINKNKTSVSTNVVVESKNSEFSPAPNDKILSYVDTACGVAVPVPVGDWTVNIDGNKTYIGNANVGVEIECGENSEKISLNQLITNFVGSGIELAKGGDLEKMGNIEVVGLKYEGKYFYVGISKDTLSFFKISMITELSPESTMSQQDEDSLNIVLDNLYYKNPYRPVFKVQ